MCPAEGMGLVRLRQHEVLYLFRRRISLTQARFRDLYAEWASEHTYREYEAGVRRLPRTLRQLIQHQCYTLSAGERLQILRRRKGWTQAEVALRAQPPLSRVTVNRAENDELLYGDQTLSRIEAAL